MNIYEWKGYVYTNVEIVSWVVDNKVEREQKNWGVLVSLVPDFRILLDKIDQIGVYSQISATLPTT